MPQNFPLDEFDEIASQGGPVGVHRATRPWWTRLTAPLVGFLIAGLVAFGVAQLLWNPGGSSSATPAPNITVTPTVTPSLTNSPSPTSSPSVTPSPSPTPTPTQTVVFDAEVAVRNGAGVAGLAGVNQTILEDAGFTNVVADNISGDDVPDANVVVYTSADLALTAQTIADALGIELTELGATPGGRAIEVLLESEPAA